MSAKREAAHDAFERLYDGLVDLVGRPGGMFRDEWWTPEDEADIKTLREFLSGGSS